MFAGVPSGGQTGGDDKAADVTRHNSGQSI